MKNNPLQKDHECMMAFVALFEWVWYTPHSCVPLLATVGRFDTPWIPNHVFFLEFMHFLL